MNPRPLDVAVVARHLRLMSDIVDSFAQVEKLRVDTTRRRTLGHYAAERMMIQLVDLATDINAHLAVTILKRAPEDYADGFRLVTRVVTLDTGIADELRRAAKMRNVLVHDYVDLDVERFAAALPRVRPVFGAYVDAVAAWLVTQPES